MFFVNLRKNLRKIIDQGKGQHTNGIQCGTVVITVLSSSVLQEVSEFRRDPWDRRRSAQSNY